MRLSTLVGRSLTYYWRSNLAVVLGVATAVAVLAGALLVGESVRGTLRDLAMSRLGATDVAVFSMGFVREKLADDLQSDPRFGEAFRAVAPLVALEGFVTVQTTGRRAGNVRVYGIDDRFWTFHGVARTEALDDRSTFISAALAEETGVAIGEPLLVRVELPSDIPLESLHGRKDDPGRTVRATVQQVLAADDRGEFSLSPEQGRIRAVFLPLARLQRELDLEGQVNTLLVATRAGPKAGAEVLTPILRRATTLDDAGLSVRPADQAGVLIVASDAGAIDGARVSAAERAARSAGLSLAPVLTYLANSIQSGSREIPYSLVTARDLSGIVPSGNADAPPPIVLGEWAARELGAAVGAPVRLEYFVWEDPGRLATRATDFVVAAVVPPSLTERDLAPAYPGITDSPTLDAWNPPFPFDLSRVRPADEDYWNRFRTTPKAFVPIEVGQRLWGTRHGNVTSLRASVRAGADMETTREAMAGALRAELEPATAGLVVRDVRADALAAAAGVTDFGEYFVYFSFFIVASAIVLAALFFRLGIEQRVREVGLLGAVGAGAHVVRRLFLTEAVVLSFIGSLVGVLGAVGHAAVMVQLLRTRWVDAIGTSALTLHVSPLPLVLGAVGGLAAAVGGTWLSLRGLRSLSARTLLAGSMSDTAFASPHPSTSRWGFVAVAVAMAALLFMGTGIAGLMAPAGAFFGAAFLMLLAGLAAVSHWYRRPAEAAVRGRGTVALFRLGFVNARARPVRSTLAVSVIAAATFIVIAVDAFRKDAVLDTGPSSGLGGYALTVESLLPIAHDLGTPEGRTALGLTGIDDVRLEPFRLRPGDDASCLNLYQPTNPRILGATSGFIARNRFRFRASMAATDVERENPWRLLERQFEDGAVPVIADANSLTYVLHKSVGEDIEIDQRGERRRLRVVAALADSVFQRDVLMAESAFVRLFPEQEGYRFALAEVAIGRSAEAMTTIEDRLSAFAVDVTPAADRLAEFHKVENTFISTFQMLGGLGLLIGTLGLGAVLLRSVLERRRELALLGAVGYRTHHLRVMLLAESASLLVVGLAIGCVAAIVASVPAAIERGGRAPMSLGGGLVLVAVFAAGVLATTVAARAATRRPLLEALRSE